MVAVVKKLHRAGLFTPPHDFVVDTVYEVIMGSMAYGVSNDASDMDIYGVCVPHKSMVFPHLTGQIDGFGPKPDVFNVYQKHHMQMNSKEYDVSVYSLVNYFQLCAGNNPNMIDSLFVPSRCVIHSTDVGDHMRAYKREFLSKRIFDKLRGYAFQELRSLENYKPKENAKRNEDVEKYGYDVKSAYHVVRLMLEAEQVLIEGDLDLEKNREQLKFVRDGGYTLDKLKNWYSHKEKELTSAHITSGLPVTADFKRLHTVLFECLELHFGKLEVAQQVDPRTVEKLERIRRIINEE